MGKTQILLFKTLFFLGFLMNLSTESFKAYSKMSEITQKNINFFSRLPVIRVSKVVNDPILKLKKSCFI